MKTDPPRASKRPTGWLAWLAGTGLATLATLVIVAMAGCASTTPDEAADVVVEIPAAWSTASPSAGSGGPSLAVWWLRFDDPMLTRLVAQSLQANPTLAGAEAALRQARALRDVSAAALFPTLGASASAQRSSATSALAPAGGRSPVNTFQAGLDAQWELDIFGGRRSALQASDAAVQTSAASLGDVQVSVAAEVALGYITLRSNQARLAIAAENLASQQETLQITRWRQQAGLTTSLEVAQARAAAEQTDALLPALQTAIAQANHALAVLVGQPPAALWTLLDPIAPVPQAGDALVLSLPAETLRQRADLRAAEYRVVAAAAQVSQAEAARLPSLAIGGSLGLSALTLGALTNGASVVGTLLASVSLPVFDGGAARAQLSAQQAALAQAQQAWRAAVLTALKEVEDALVAVRGDRQRLARLDEAADAAGSAALLARQRYASGLVDFQTVLETQRSQLATQDGVALARADLGADHVRLYKALGGGWQPPTNIGQAAAPP